MPRFLVISRWWDRVMGWALWLRRRPRCARTPFEGPDTVRTPDDDAPRD